LPRPALVISCHAALLPPGNHDGSARKYADGRLPPVKTLRQVAQFAEQTLKRRA
jgi:hypothetical protein